MSLEEEIASELRFLFDLDLLNRFGQQKDQLLVELDKNIIARIKIVVVENKEQN